MTIHDEIAKLPEWPKAMRGMPLETAADRLEAALARLALAQKWINDRPHAIWCISFGAPPSAPCTCGRDALLAAMEPPK